MPPKFDPSSPENAALIQLFTNLGLSNVTATELVRQPKQGVAVKGLIDTYQLESEQLDERRAAALVKLATAGGKLGEGEKGFVVQKVLKEDLKSVDQITGKLSRPYRPPAASLAA